MANTKKTNNDHGAWPYKVWLRRWLVDQVEDPRVLDCYAGSQVLRRACYPDIPWRGIDLKRLGPDQWVGDNRRIVRSIDLSPYTILDLDAYGEPWELLSILTKRKTLDQRLGLALTGSSFNAMHGRLSHICGSVIGQRWWPAGGDQHGHASPALLVIDLMEQRLAERWGARIIDRYRHNPGRKIQQWYDALILEPR